MKGRKIQGPSVDALMREVAALTARLANAENTIIALRAAAGEGIGRKHPARSAPVTGSRQEHVVRERTRELTVLTGELQAEIRERMRTEERLLAEMAYREAVENCLAVGIVAVDPRGRHFHVNDAFCALTGFRREDLLGAGIPYPYWHSDERKAYAAAMRKVLKGEITPGGREVRYMTRDGRSLDVLLFASRLTVAGKIVGSLASVHDITDRKRMESALRESEAKFQNLVETVSDLVWEVDRNGIYTYVSPKVKDILGYAPEELLGKTPFDLMPAFEARRVAETFRAVSERAEPFQGLENINRHRDGHFVVIETSGAPVFDAEGRFQGYRGVDRDIGERKRAEEKLRISEERHARTVGIEDIADQADESPDPLRISDARLSVEKIMRALEELSPRQADIFLACFMHGVSTEEAATKHGVSPRTVQTDLRAAVFHCARRLGRKDVFADRGFKVSKE